MASHEGEGLRPRHDVAIIGGGVSGLVAAWRLLQGGVKVTLYEKEARLGGLASSFPLEDGFLERYYHFICRDDTPYFELLEELGLVERLRWKLTGMGQYHGGRLHSFGAPWDLFFFPALPLRDRLRFGLRIMAIKAQPAGAWRSIEDRPVADWMVETFGRKTFEVLHRPMLERKFGPAARDLSAAWMWARIHRLGKSRTRLLQLEKLGYLEGGTQALVDALTERLLALGAEIVPNTPVDAIVLEGGQARAVSCGGTLRHFDAVLSTIPTPHLPRLVTGPGAELLANLEDIGSMGVTCLVLRLRASFSRFFWINVSDERTDIAGVIEYTNLNPGVCANGDSIVYIPQYLPPEDPRWGLDDERILEGHLKDLRILRPDFDRSWIRRWWVFRDPYAQPVCTTGFSRRVQEIATPVKGLFITDAHQLYPDDRTISNSIGLGRRATSNILDHLSHGGKG